MGKAKGIALGVFEVGLFLKAGVGRFPADKRAAVISFWTVAVSTLLTTILFYYAPSERLGSRSFSDLLFLYTMINALEVAVFFTGTYYVAKMLKKTVHFWQFVTAMNYALLVPALVTLPLAVTVLTGAHSWEEIYNLLIVVFFYGLALRGFVATFSMRVPWEFGASIGFFAMFIHQAVAETVFALWGIS